MNRQRRWAAVAGILTLAVSILGAQAGSADAQTATAHPLRAAHGQVRPRVAQNGSGSPFVTFNVFSTPGVDNALGGGIAAGPDGRMWITDLFGGTVDAITTNGAVTQFAAPGGAQGIAAGPRSQGRVLWFTRQNPPSLNRITTAGTITTFPLPAPAGRPVSVVAGPDGAMWFTTWNPATIGRISAHGHITQFPLAGGADAREPHGRAGRQPLVRRFLRQHGRADHAARQDHAVQRGDRRIEIDRGMAGGALCRRRAQGADRARDDRRPIHLFP